ncbi:MAG: hypothetical protein VX035_06880 [Planctomycetota bacterium]|nr:hypothetical protein [Planctomycetota bacterium]
MSPLNCVSKTPIPNPFSTVYLTPGAQNYALPAPLSWHGLFRKYCLLGQRVSILGEHGVGKTTLLATLIAQWQEFLPENSKVLVYRVGQNGGLSVMQLSPRIAPGGKRLTTLVPKQPISFSALLRKTTQDSIIVVDGYDAWSWWERKRLMQRTTRCRAGLIVTSHERSKLPPLLRLSPEFQDFVELLNRWQPKVGHIERACLQDVWNRHRGNLRECLFDLYHWWETREHRDSLLEMRTPTSDSSALHS